MGFGPDLRYVVRRYGYSEADNTAEAPYHIPQLFIDAYWRRLDKQKNNKALLVVFWEPLGKTLSSSTSTFQYIRIFFKQPPMQMDP